VGTYGKKTMPQIKYKLEDVKKPIIGGYRIEEVYQDPEIIPFLCDINTHYPEDLEALRSWMIHFIERDIPFVVIEKVRNEYNAKWQLWKHGIDV